MRKLKFLVSASVLSGLSACFSQAAPSAHVAVLDGVKLTQHEVKLLQQAKSEGKTDITVVDAGKGKQEGGSFLFTVRFNDGEFSTKQSVNGFARKTETSVHYFNVALVESTGAPSGNITSADIQQIIPANLTGGGSDERTILFKNVDTNSSTNDYYVVLAALEDTDPGVPVVYKNITNAGAPVNLNMGPGNAQGKAYVSDTGGDGGNTGKVNVGVSPTYAVSSTNTLSFSNFKLLDETGATVDSHVTVVDGTSGYTGSVTVE